MNSNKVNEIAVDLTIVVGKSEIEFGELKDLKRDSVVPIAALADEMFILKAGNRNHAKGVVEEVDGQLQFTIKELL